MPSERIAQPLPRFKPELWIDTATMSGSTLDASTAQSGRPPGRPPSEADADEPNARDGHGRPEPQRLAVSADAIGAGVGAAPYDSDQDAIALGVGDGETLKGGGDRYRQQLHDPYADDDGEEPWMAWCVVLHYERFFPGCSPLRWRRNSSWLGPTLSHP